MLHYSAISIKNSHKQFRQSIQINTSENRESYMRKILTTLYLSLLMSIFSLNALAENTVATNVEANPRVNLQTNHGLIVLELDRKNAPNSTENFLTYVNDGFYEGTVFHRVIKDFMIQGGGFDQDYKQKETRDPINNEADNGLTNMRGTVAMARTGDPQSATAQFFINTVDNAFLDHSSATPGGWGYAVFGKVVEGMEVVDTIRAIETGSAARFPGDVPTTPVIIEKATVVEN
jgi:peptidyl-prolyl cis-trans isomerase B (cyclophilin B)